MKVRNSSKSLRFKELLEFHALSSMKWKTVLSFESTETKKNMIFSVPLLDVECVSRSYDDFTRFGVDRRHGGIKISRTVAILLLKDLFCIKVFSIPTKSPSQRKACVRDLKLWLRFNDLHFFIC